ncbi:MAG: WecB/TagA/CpsF family glycosyltransferase [bacterium]
MHPRSEQTNILNVQINTQKKQEILEKVYKMLKSGRQHYIVTPNPEMVMMALQDFYYLNILNKADLKLPDGIGLKFASFLMENRIKQRIKGVDFIEDLCNIASHHNYSIFFLGGEKGVAEKTANALKKKFPKLNIAGFDDGGKVNENGVLQDKSVLAKIKQSNPDILFVAFGCPKQEKFIVRYLPKLKSVKIAIGVGGAFDFLSGKIKRAPRLFRVFGFEWLWRLIKEPKKRIKRIYTATVRFPLGFLRWRFSRRKNKNI